MCKVTTAAVNKRIPTIRPETKIRTRALGKAKKNPAVKGAKPAGLSMFEINATNGAVLF